ncbi:MAG: hypothetical protein ACOCNL_11070 [Acetivibrio ethanolgignens]
MINVSTFVYNSSKKTFNTVPQCSILELQKLPGRLEYIDGYLSIQYFGYELMGEQYHDDIIFLWNFIINGIQTYLEKKYVCIPFPGTTSELLIKGLPRNQLLFSIGQRKEVLPSTEFLNSLLSAADTFFNWIGENLQVETISKMKKII